jgi:hypothetical protein
MKRNLTALFVMSLIVAIVGSAQTTPSSNTSSTQFTQAQLKKLSKEAGTPGQYAVLASGYSTQQKDYLAQAADEKQEWARRSTNIMLTAAKYPRPVDSAHYLYDYYTYKAGEAGQLAAKYALLAGQTGPAAVK